ncbi:uncharacterized protein LY79DRAFT_559858 [Colletotrichum navitas]|uniref:CorA-like Mg2+ transporter n=1 Tax=Colletotrichum navitas TaxID=681940 RepID=A0AAD8V2J4_9PEZI|nr:uncharacterized protein LY79DRAFT_559858 [Colletotrichum navitas]KAK1584947.1 hypothetical protein LY79DRAFT_559858 [Colletotrichum navitas]
MFNAERQRLLGSCRWCPDEGQLGYFEAWTDGSAGPVAGNYRTGFLDDDEVEQWLHQQGRFSRRAKPGQARPAMRIRLLMCERVGWLPVGFAMSRSSFLAMETAFRLSTETLPILVANNGRQYSNLRFSEDNDSRLESIALTVKLPQMFQLGNLGLAMSHHLETGTTVAFLHGWNVFSNRNYVTDEPTVSHAEDLCGMMQSATTLWAHPLFLPAVLVREHLSRAEAFKSRLEPKVTDIERGLGVTRSARLVGLEVNASVQHMVQDDQERLRITARLNTTATDVVNMLGILDWDLQHVKFLGRVNDDLGALHGRMSPAADAELRSVVEYLECEALSIVSFVGTMKSRLDLQLNVLYNFIAQAENNLNMKIAANAGLDSTAMKTLAVVTMVFLPPTFVATIFSMSMFDWQGSSSTAGETNGTVVPEFWIYWAVSVPLTLAIVIGWRFWWHFQKGYYENKYLSVKPSEVPRSRRRGSGGA